MSGRHAGGLLAAETNKKRHGADYYVKLGRLGGAKGTKDGTIKGFAAHPELARTAGAKGGRISRRGKV
jgi:hypothetical protein